MAVDIGVIAEDNSDIETLYSLACKLGKENSFAFKKFVGHGCGKFKKKCRPWAEALRARGCDYLVVVQDLDNRTEPQLRVELEKSVSNTGFTAHVVVIPTRELEAWLLADPKALKSVFKTKRLPVTPYNPETIVDPKAEIARIVRKAGGTLYLNTIHNRQIAAQASIVAIKGRCASFAPYAKFIQGILK